MSSFLLYHRPMNAARNLALSACVAMFGAGCAHLDAARLPAIAQALEAAVQTRQMPGAVFWLERQGQVYQHAHGLLSYLPHAPAVRADTLYDVASLTKVMATAPSVLLLVEEGRIGLDAPLTDYFAGCQPGITIAQLLTHTSGLPAGLPANPDWSGPERAHQLACSRKPTHPPGTFFRYSDVNYILLGQLVERVSGMPLQQFAQERIFVPLGMRDTGYLPRELARIAPTGTGPAGIVHDPSTRRMGGVGGAAGLFSSAADVARFARMLLAGGQGVLSADSVRLLTTVQTPPGMAETRAMGMDIDSPFARPRGSLFPVGSFGHTGFTGCFLWIDPQSGSFYLLLSNRVYPDQQSNILSLYSELGTLAAQAVLRKEAP